MPGNGTLLTASALGFAYTGRRRGGTYPHPFKPALGPMECSFSRGLVDIYEPKIRGVKISEGPALRLDAKLANDDGESWCCIEVEPNEFGQADKNSRLEMVHTDQPVSIEAKVGRCAVAMILWREGQPIAVHEILYFNVRYKRVEQRAGPPMHLFF